MKRDSDAAYNQREWTREEVVVLVYEYFRTRYMSSEEIKQSLENISCILRKRELCLTNSKEISETFRNYSGVRMQYSRIRCLDPDTSYNGMKATKLQKEVFAEYVSNSQKILQEARCIMEKYS